MFAKASSILRAVAQISSLTVGIWRSLQITVFGIYQDVSTIMYKVSIGNVLEFLCWKWKLYPGLYSISPDWFKHCFIYETLLLGFGLVTTHNYN
jgi:hypothetical protein